MSRDDILAALRQFKGDYAEQYGILELGVFGSVARNEQREDSDVDICIKTKTPDPFVLVHIKDLHCGKFQLAGEKQRLALATSRLPALAWGIKSATQVLS